MTTSTMGCRLDPLARAMMISTLRGALKLSCALENAVELVQISRFYFFFNKYWIIYETKGIFYGVFAVKNVTPCHYTCCIYIIIISTFRDRLS
jgi:hypothetical protein